MKDFEIPISNQKRGGARAIHAIDVADLAVVADALLADGRNDLAAQMVSVMYYCAERGAAYRNQCEDLVPMHDHKSGGDP